MPTKTQPTAAAQTPPIEGSQATAVDRLRPPADQVTAEAILDATLASEIIIFDADMHVSGWTSIAAEGTLVPSEDRASVETHLAELGERTIPLLALSFANGQATSAPVKDPSNITQGDGLSEVLFAIDSFAEGNTLREFFRDVLTQVELAVVTEGVLTDSVYTKLTDVETDDEIDIEVLVDDQLRLRRIDMSRPTLSGEDHFDQYANFSYSQDPVPVAAEAGVLPDLPHTDVARVITEDMNFCSQLVVVYTTRLDFRHRAGDAAALDLSESIQAFNNAHGETFNVYDNQQLMRDTGQSNGYRSLLQIEFALHGHLAGGVPVHGIDLTEFEEAADRFGQWVRELCPVIAVDLINLPDIGPLLVPPTSEQLAAGQAAFCPALVEVFATRDQLRAFGGDDAPFTSEAAAAYTEFRRAVDHASVVHDEATFVSSGPELSYRYRSAAFLEIETQVRQAIFTPAVPMDEWALRGWGEHMEAIESFARDTCAANVLPWQIDAPSYDPDGVTTIYGDSPEDSFCHNAEHELQLRRAFRDQLERLEPESTESITNAHALARRLIATASGSRNDYAVAFSTDGVEYTRSWWLVSTVEWILLTPVPTPATMPSLDFHGVPFEPSHDPAPEELDAQIAAITDAQSERDAALAIAGRLCGFSNDLLDAGDDVALLKRLWG